MRHATFKSYITGYALSILFTLIAFGFVFVHQISDHNIFSHKFLTPALIILALIQLYVQMVYFLHLGKEPKPKNNLITFWLTVLFVGIVVIGSLWIMANLNHNMSDSEMEEYMHKEVGI